MVAVMELSVEDLVRKAQGGDKAAFGRLYDRLSPDVLRFLAGLRLGLPVADLEDAAHETFLRFYKQLERYDSKRRLRPWVLGIARHVALDVCKKRVANMGSDPERLEDSGVLTDEVEARELQDLVAKALDALTPDQRTILTLRHINDLTMLDLAAVVDCSVPTARKRLLDAARLFEGQLRERGIQREEDRS
jgi:RNA polymerase sigma-70 factor (ECF subfamily)